MIHQSEIRKKHLWWRCVHLGWWVFFSPLIHCSGVRWDVHLKLDWMCIWMEHISYLQIDSIHVWKKLLSDLNSYCKNCFFTVYDWTRETKVITILKSFYNLWWLLLIIHFFFDKERKFFPKAISEILSLPLLVASVAFSWGLVIYYPWHSLLCFLL